MKYPMGARAPPIWSFIKTKLYKLEGNKSLVKEQIGKSLSYIIGIGAPQKW